MPPTCCSSFQDLCAAVTAVAACVGVYFAYQGLRTWRTQLRGHTEYDLARRLLRASLAVRDKIQFVRLPFMSGSEITAAMRAADKPIPESKGQLAGIDEMAITYQRRWEAVTKALSDLGVEVLEAEVLWGTEAVTAVDDLRTCARELGFSLQDFIEDRRRENRGTPPDIERAERIRATVFMTGTAAADDPFTFRVGRAVARIEAFVRPHLLL